MRNFTFLIIVIFSLFFCNSVTQESIKKRVDSDTIPKGAIKLEYDQYIYIPIFLNDSIKAKAMFDTGAPGLPLMNDSLAPLFNFNYEKGHYMSCFLLDGCMMCRLPKHKLKTKIGDFNYMQKYAVCDIRKFECDILLGIREIDKIVIEIDLEKKYLNFIDSLKKKSQYFADIVRQKHILVPLTIITQSGKAFSGNFILDTGYPGMIMLFDEPKKSEIISEIPDSSKIVAKYLSGYEETTFRPAKLKIGNYLFDEPVVDVSNISLKSKIKGLIGNNFIKKFNIKIDLKENKLYLSPKQKKETKNDIFHSGIISINPLESKEGLKYEIAGIVIDRNADKAGFKLGDKIIEINGKLTRNIPIDTLKHYFKKPVGTTLELKIERENNVFMKSLVLEKLY
jgi:predicted aspartyl protease